MLRIGSWLFLVVVLLIGLVVLFTAGSHGDDFQGAGKLLEKLHAPPSPKAGPTGAPDSLLALHKDTETYKQKSAALVPTEAAKQWLALFDRTILLANDTDNYYRTSLYSGPCRDIMLALPGPEIWPELQKQVEARPTIQDRHATLSLIVHTLNNEEEKQWADLAAIPTPTAQDASLLLNLLPLGNQLSAVANRPEQVAKFWGRTLDLLQKVPAQSIPDGPNALEFDLPDLVAILGSDQAVPLLKKALLLPHTRFRSVKGLVTQQLARQLALDYIDKLSQAPWCLTESLDAEPLFVALMKKFPASGSDAQNGLLYHVLSLVIHGKPDEALTAAAGLGNNSLESAVNQAANAGWATQVYAFFEVWLKANPDGDWSTYLHLAAQTGHAEDALKLVQTTLKRRDVSDAVQGKLRTILYRALLAADRVDEGLTQLRLLIQTAKNNIPDHKPANGQQDNAESELLTLDIELARIGHVLKRPALEDEGLKDARLRSPKDRLITYLMETGRLVEAEKYLIEQIVDQTQQQKAAAANQPYGNPGSFYSLRESLVKLSCIYYHAGRWADILTLLEQAPGWGAGDLLAVAGQEASVNQQPDLSMGLMAAAALAGTAKMDQARPILDYMLQTESGSDAVYALFLKIGEGDRIAKLDALYKQDQFQERPLIWKATLLLQQGKLDEAERTCKAAITIDPSDGEQGKGDRMRVYSVLADIYAAKKDDKQAAFFHNVVKAIRLSEDADDFSEAGLLTRAATMYTQSLDLFSDAYCIQSRLARQLAQLGRMEEAAQHYRRAFELMPGSFGRMESHCFGCERAFEGKTAVSVAEKTFNDMQAKDPTKPQIPYLLGYLYMEEERYPEAVANFQKAVELDPDYINAWKQLSSIGSNYQLSPALRDAAVFNILRLDPRQRHTSPNLEEVRDLAKLWRVEEDCLKAIPPTPTNLFPLKAAAIEQANLVAKRKKLLSGLPNADALMEMQEQVEFELNSIANRRTTPQEAIIKNAIISSAFSL